MFRTHKKPKQGKRIRPMSVDPYTGGLEPDAEDARKLVRIRPPVEDRRHGRHYLLEEETNLDFLAADESAEEVAAQLSSFTEDEQIEEDFAERQRLGAPGRQKLEKRLDAHNSKSPGLSGGDLDADWERADQSGEETVGGSVSTPDQDSVDEIGRAAGLTYEDDEPLHTGEKLRRRDERRAELEPDWLDDELTVIRLKAKKKRQRA